MTRRKHNNIPTTVEGIEFDSQWEAECWRTLRLMERSGEIRGLRDHVSYPLQESFRDRFGKFHLAITHVPDFDYWEGNQHVVADAKGYRTDVFNIKYKLFCKRYPDIRYVILPKITGRGRR